MSSNDSSVQLPSAGSGPFVDTEAVSTASGTAGAAQMVQRQRVAVGDGVSGFKVAVVEAGALSVDLNTAELILLELRRIRRGLEILTNEELTNED
jgi:hypothetical protein